MAEYRIGQRVKLHDKSCCGNGIGYIKQIKPDGMMRISDKLRETDDQQPIWGAWVKDGEFDLLPESCGFIDRNAIPVYLGMRAMSMESDSMNQGKIGVIRDYGASHRDREKKMVRISSDSHENRDGYGWSSWVQEDDLVVIPEESDSK